MRSLYVVRSVCGLFFLVLAFIPIALLAALRSRVYFTESFRQRTTAFIGRLTLACFNIRLNISGKENLKQGVILAFNHTGQADIPALLAALDKNAFLCAKKELFKVPILGLAMRALKLIEIDRQNRERVFKTYDSLIPRALGGENFILSIEGKRNTSKKTLGDLKRGPFLFALKGKIPIQPVVIHGAQEVMPIGARLPNAGNWQGQMFIEILPILETNGLSESDVDLLQSQVRDLMVSRLERPNDRRSNPKI